MGDFLKTVQNNALLQAILFIVLGLVLLLFPNITLIAIVICIGAIFAISGAISLAAYFRKSSASYKMSGALTTAIFCFVIAIVMFLFPVATASFFSVLFGAVLILCGIANMVRALSVRVVDTSLWIIGCALGALTIVGGILIIWNPFATSSLFVMILGALLVLNGITDLFVELAVRKSLDS